MVKALYRKYRSKTLDEIVGQSHITDILSRAIKSGKISHAYLLTGPRGVGKTSIARILAHEINKLPYEDETTHLDIIEIDAASNTSVEDVRDLREKARLAPVSAEKKIYIIDEVHMLSKSAFNALLKTLEEPPEHVIFILATTDAEKLPETILSRVQRFNFRTISPEDISHHLAQIAAKESIDIDSDALDLIARHGRGSFRDSISLLDQVQNISESKISRQDIESMLGITPDDMIEQLLQAYQANDIKTILSVVDNAEIKGISAENIANQIIYKVRPRLADEPQLIDLVDKLIEVSKSNWPHIKLLSALSSNRNSAVHVSTPTQTTRPVQAKKAETPAEEAAEPSKSNEKTASASELLPVSNELDWQKFLGLVKEQSMAEYSLLAGCEYELTKNKLIIFAGKPFTKKRLESPKYLSVINQALSKIVRDAPEVVVEGSKKPPKDSQAAKVVAMMGGGEEVKIDGQI